MNKRTLSNLLSKENMKYKENIAKFRKLNETANILGEDVSFASRLENDDTPSTSRAALGYSDAHTLDDDNFPSTSRAPSENSIVDHYDLSEDEDDRYLFEDFEESESHVDESLNINVDKFAKIKAFALRSKLSQNDVTDMLKTLREIGCEGLPLSARTLLGTSREKVDLKSIPGGELLYIGIEFYLKCSKYNFLENQEEVNIDVGIDGLKLFKSSNRCLWPILGYVVGSNLNPFTIACFSGMSKPENVNDFLEDFCEDVIALKENGIKVGENEIVKKFNVRLFTCDAPARAFVTGVMYHNAKNSCSKCVSRGQSEEGRVAFQTTISELRTDLSFKNRLDLSHHNPKFRESELLLETANIGMVSQFPLDPMHLVDIGVTKKLLKLISVFGNVTQMNEKLSFLNRFIPSDFCRLSRDLDQIHNWKSTELRQFLLYTGPFVLRDCIPEKYYTHFLLLSASIRILSCDRSHIVESNVAREMLKMFVRLYADYYGKHLISYNLHALLHLCDCVKQFGPLDNFSAYKFENFMQHLKKIIKKPTQILQQLYLRTLERLDIVADSSKFSERGSFIINYKKEKDSFFQSNKGPIKIVGLEEGSTNFNAFLIVNLENYFVEPLESISGLGIVVGSLSGERVIVSQTDIEYKYFCIPQMDSFILIPLLHDLFHSFS